MTTTKYPGSSIHVGQEFSIVSTSDQFDSATDQSFSMALRSSAVVVNYYLVSGSATVELYTGTEGRERLLDTYVIAGPSAELTNRRYDDVSDTIRCRVITTGAAQLEVRLKGAHSTADTNIDVEINDSALVVSNPAITNITLGSANTESSVALPSNTKKYAIKARGNSRLQFSYVSGQSGTQYWTEFPGFTLEETNVDRASTTVYVRASKANEVLEIKTWT